MTDLTVIERDIRRILKSHRSIVQQTAMAESLFQRINGLLASITDERTRSQFRADYKALIERTFGQSKTRVAELFLDHARNLKEVEATSEKLNRELGDF
jgi:hypothetical protein